MASSNCCFLTCIQVSQEAGQVVWYSHLFQNFPQFIVIHTVTSSQTTWLSPRISGTLANTDVIPELGRSLVASTALRISQLDRYNCLPPSQMHCLIQLSGLLPPESFLWNQRKLSTCPIKLFSDWIEPRALHVTNKVVYYLVSGPCVLLSRTICLAASCLDNNTCSSSAQSVSTSRPSPRTRVYCTSSTGHHLLRALSKL